MFRWSKFLTEDNGATAVEYALILGAITLTAIAALEKLGAGANRAFHTVDESLPTR